MAMPASTVFSTPLSIAVVGAGAIGSTFAFQLARAGHDLAIFARPGSTRLEQLRRDDAVVRTNGERATMRVCGNLDETVAYDLVLVTVLAHQVDSLLPSLARGSARCVQFMFNTFDPERALAAVGAERCSLGMPFVMAKLDREGRIDATISAARRTLHGDLRWVRLFEDAGVPSAHEPDMTLWLRCHAPLCIAMESISVAARRRGKGASWRQARIVARAMKAGFETVKARGERLYPVSKAMLGAAPDPLLAAMLWTMSRSAPFTELLATGENECRALIAAMIQAALSAGHPLPDAAAALAAASPAPVTAGSG